jgi:L-alanine-DL-glutamate epimerase-like enolase superfamily enzyme
LWKRSSWTCGKMGFGAADGPPGGKVWIPMRAHVRRLARPRIRYNRSMRMIIHVLDLPLRHTFTIAHGSVHVQRNAVVELVEDGLHGYGEGAVGSAFAATAESVAAGLESVRHVVEGARFETPDEFWQRLRLHLNENRFALCALDQAAHDLWGKRLGQPVWRLWGLDVGRCPPSCYTIGIDTVEKMVDKMREFPGWPVYKIGSSPVWLLALWT